MLLGLRPYPKREKKPEDKKEEKKEEKKVEKKEEKPQKDDQPKSKLGYGEMAIIVGAVALVGFLVFKAHKKCK
jgi:hypothetical protein